MLRLKHFLNECSFYDKRQSLNTYIVFKTYDKTKITHPDGGPEEIRCREQIGMMVMRVVVVMMVSPIRTTPSGYLLRLDRHCRAGQSLSFPKPIPFHAESKISVQLVIFNLLVHF